MVVGCMLFSCAGTPKNKNAHDHHAEQPKCDHDHEAGHDHDHDHDHEDDQKQDHQKAHESDMDKGHEHKHEGDETEHSKSTTQGVKEIEFNPNALSPGLFAMEKVQFSNFSPVIRVGGQLLPVATQTAEVVSPVNGVIRLGGTALYPGSTLTKGQLLAYVSTSGLGEGDAQAKAEAAMRNAKAEYDRAASLIQDKLVSQREYEQALLTYEQAKIACQIWNNSSKEMVLKAPKSGYLLNIYVQNGDYVQAGQRIATLTTKDRLCLQAHVPQRYADRISKVKSANFRVAGQAAVFSLEQKQGRLVSIGQSSTANGTIPISFELNGKDLIPGTMAEVFLKISEGKKVLAVPMGAVTEEQGFFYVYVHQHGNHYAKRSVVLGESDGQKVQIRDGIQDGERMVVKGAYLVKMAGANGEIPHGHTH